jgi:enamine deaminase RidA (YjgF/YER057c/UK114 family)
MRQIAPSGSPLKRLIGFCRATRIRPHVAVAGTASIGADGQTVREGDVRAQTRRFLEISAEALAAVGATLRDVVRTRVMPTGMPRWVKLLRYTGSTSHMLAATFIEVSGFIDNGRG